MPVIEHLAHCKYIILFLFSSLSFAQNYPINEVDTLIKKGIELTIHQQYDDANKIFYQLKNGYPELPLGDIYLAGVEITKSVDYGEKLDTEKLNTILLRAEKLSDSLLSADDDNVWHNYFIALTKAFVAYQNALSYDYLNAFIEGYISIIYFEECLKYDNKFYESYLAIGTYLYWKNAKSESFNWLPFVRDNRDEGIKLIETAIDKSSYSNYLALQSLIWIYINEKSYLKAIELCEEFLSKFPENRLIKLGLARAYQEVDKEKSVRFYSEILYSLRKLGIDNNFNEIVFMHKIAMLEFDLGNYAETIRLCDQILSLQISEKLEERLAERIQRIKKLKKHCLEIESKN